ncbi:uncharacterized protein LOC121868785 [Homarus americanus]|uniref:uncharacterized protein LOC121868785 n=1 Tax=Homarus americanus TaxID=6706 RepID=UPI001C47E32C|nr:uncharacterized protein LOC121868785 [Homarus americanus]
MEKFDVFRNIARSILGVLLLVATVNGAMGWFCYSHTPGKEGTGWIFCPSTSCYTVGVSIFGVGDSKRGCADKSYPDTCQKATTIIASGDVCFCNGFLCNYSSAGTTSLFLPLLILPYVLHKFL